MNFSSCLSKEHLKSINTTHKRVKTSFCCFTYFRYCIFFSLEVQLESFLYVSFSSSPFVNNYFSLNHAISPVFFSFLTPFYYQRSEIWLDNVILHKFRGFLFLILHLFYQRCIRVSGRRHSIYIRLLNKWLIFRMYLFSMNW